MKTKLKDFLNEEKQISPNPKTLTDLIYKIANTDKDGDFKLGNIKGSVVARDYGYWGYFKVDFYFKKDNPRFAENWDHFATWNQNTGGYEECELEILDYKELISTFKDAIKKAGFDRSELEVKGEDIEEVQESNMNKTEKDIWWGKNYQRLIAFVESPIALDIVNSLDAELGRIWQDETAKHRALTLLNLMDLEEIENELKEFEDEIQENMTNDDIMINPDNDFYKMDLENAKEKHKELYYLIPYCKTRKEADDIQEEIEELEAEFPELCEIEYPIGSR